jgi:hypothetical protein
MGEKRGEGRLNIEVRRPKVREPKLSEQKRDIVLRVGELRRIRLPEVEIDEFYQRVAT